MRFVAIGPPDLWPKLPPVSVLQNINVEPQVLKIVQLDWGRVTLASPFQQVGELGIGVHAVSRIYDSGHLHGGTHWSCGPMVSSNVPPVEWHSRLPSQNTVLNSLSDYAAGGPVSASTQSRGVLRARTLIQRKRALSVEPRQARLERILAP